MSVIDGWCVCDSCNGVVEYCNAYTLDGTQTLCQMCYEQSFYESDNECQ